MGATYLGGRGISPRVETAISCVHVGAHTWERVEPAQLCGSNSSSPDLASYQSTRIKKKVESLQSAAPSPQSLTMLTIKVETAITPGRSAGPSGLLLQLLSLDPTPSRAVTAIEHRRSPSSNMALALPPTKAVAVRAPWAYFRLSSHWNHCAHTH